MTQRVNFSILFCTISILTAQAQWNKQDSIRLQELLNGDGELKNQHRSRKVYPFRLSIGQRQYKRYSNHVRRQTVDEVSERLA
mgnify:CR=1 FL=1